MAEDHSSGPDLRRYIEPYRRRIWLVLAIVILLPAAVYGISKQLPKTYEASTIVLTRATTASSAVFGNTGLTTGSTSDVLTLIGTTAVAERAVKELGRSGADAGDLSGTVSAALTSPDDPYGSEFISITAEDSDPVRAADSANAYAAALSISRTKESKDEIRKTISRLERQAAEVPPADKAAEEQLNTQLQELRGLLASQADSTQVIEPAAVPSSPIAPNPRQNTALAFVLALLLAAGAVPLADALNRRLRDPSELEPLLDVSMLAQIPERAFPGHAPSNDVRESFQTLRASLTYFNLDRDLELLLITSPGHSEGKTTVTTNLAIAIARDGSDVVLVDGDLRKPQAAARLGLEPTLGLEEVLVGDADCDDALLKADVEGGSLRVLGASGPARNPAILLGSARMRNLLDQLQEKCDLVIVDTPPLLAVSDAIPLLKDASGVILIGQVNRTHTNALSKAREVIAAGGGTLLGSVATGAKSGGLYGYGGYEGYGYEDHDDEQGAAEEEPASAAKTGAAAEPTEPAGLTDELPANEEQPPPRGEGGPNGGADDPAQSLRDRLSRY